MISPKTAIEHYASSNYGQLILVDEPQYDEEEGFYVSNLRSDYPLVIRNEHPPKKKSVHVLEIENLGFITSNKEGKILKDFTTSREECIRNITSFFDMWKRRAEEIVVAASADNLAKSIRFNHFFDPIDEILSSIWEYHFVNDAEINFRRGKERRRKTVLYLKFLEGLEIVRKEDNGYSEGNLTVALRDKYRGDVEGFRQAMLSTILRERYSTLRDVFKLRILEPAVRVDNCIYLPEMEVEEEIHRSLESIRYDFSNYYHRSINKYSLERVLRQLVEVGAINQDRKHYFGNSNLLKTMIQMKKERPSLNRELLSKA